MPRNPPPPAGPRVPARCPDCRRPVNAKKNEGRAQLFNLKTFQMERVVPCIGCPCGWIATTRRRRSR